MADSFSGSRPKVPGRPPLGAIASAPEKVTREEMKKAALQATCTIHKQPFLLCLERMDEGGWKVTAAYPVPAMGQVILTRSPALHEVSLPALSPVRLDGAVVMGQEYLGCPWCQNRKIFRCSCGAFNCQGASRTHGDHNDAFCGACNQWRCLGGKTKGLTLKNTEGYTATADVQRPRIEVLQRRMLPPAMTPELPRASQTALILRGRKMP
jgi:hypothetical protein